MANVAWLQVVSGGRLTRLVGSLLEDCHRFMQKQSSEYHIDGGPVINFEALARIIRVSESSAQLIAHNNNEYAYVINTTPESVGKLLWTWHCWCYANGRQCLTE